MLRRRTTGSVVCPSCGSLVGVRDDKCYTCGRTNPGLWGFAPALRQLGADFGFVPIVVGASAVLYVLTLVASGPELQPYEGGLSFLVPSTRAIVLFGASGFYPVYRDGAWWTLLSASWLHASFLHILFNMMWVRDLGSTMVDLIGAPRTIIIYVVGGIAGFFLSSSLPWLRLPLPILHGAGYTLGASASIFGLLGALVHYGRKSGSSLIHGQAVNYAVILFVMGLFMPGVDNSAHAGGFVGGYAMSVFFNPLTREKGDHLIVALVCLTATLAAVLFSVAHGLGVIG
jgi:membrane associated rhomboid family serine protease